MDESLHPQESELWDRKVGGSCWLMCGGLMQAVLCCRTHSLQGRVPADNRLYVEVGSRLQDSYRVLLTGAGACLSVRLLLTVYLQPRLSISLSIYLAVCLSA